MESHVMIKFLPTTLNQLFRVLTSATQEDVAVNVTRQAFLTLSLTGHRQNWKYQTFSVYVYNRNV